VSARILGIGTAVPPNVVTQAEARDFARGFFSGDFPDIDRLLEAFAHTGIDERHLVRPTSWYGVSHDFPEKNAVYREAALELALAASVRALEAAGVSPGRIGAILFVSSTGVATPSLDAHIIQRLGLPLTTARLPIWGLGCAGGAAGLGRAADLVTALGKPVLLVAVEICSSTFMHGDRSKSNVIATALFADGAAALVVAPDGDGPEVLGSHSHLVENSEDVMGWTVTTEGLQVVFSRSIPHIVRALASEVAASAAQSVGLEAGDFANFVFHPGGAKVLAAYEETFSLSPDRLQHATSVLRDYGNMSSPSVLFVLDRFLAGHPRSGAQALLMALGPGFCAESVILRW
jgi:alkylresorcinol/alkylpyrone synthase